MSAFPRRWPVVTAAAWLLFAALAAVLAVHGWRSFGFERAAIDWSAGHRPAAARHVAIGVTVLGTGVPPYLIALAAGVVLARSARGSRTRRQDLTLLLVPVLWLIAGQLVREGLMHAFARLRPSSVHWATTASGFSFPSGHSFTSAVCAGLLVLAIARRRPSWTRAACAVAVLYAVAVGLSRVYLGVHWPLDVLGSWLLAAGWLAAGSAVLAHVDPGRGDAPAPGPAPDDGTPAHRGGPGGVGGADAPEPGGGDVPGPAGPGEGSRPERGPGDGVGPAGPGEAGHPERGPDVPDRPGSPGAGSDPERGPGDAAASEREPGRPGRPGGAERAEGSASPGLLERLRLGRPGQPGRLGRTAVPVAAVGR